MTLLLSSRQMIAGVGTMRLWPDPGSLSTKTVEVELKALTDAGAGEFEGTAAVYNALDLQSEIIDRGAFETSLQRRRIVPLLFQHDPNQILGSAELTDTPEGLRVRGKLNLAVSRAAEIYAILKKQALGLSIGFRTVADAWVGRIRHLKEIDLYEISVAVFPAQPRAVVTAVKSQDIEQAELAAIRDLLAETRQWLRSRGR